MNVENLTLKILTEDPSIEDFVLSPTGLSYFQKARWHGPFESRDTKEEALWKLGRQIAEKAGLTLSATQPSVDSYLEDPSGRAFRAHVVIAPLCMKGIEITLRRIHWNKVFDLDDFDFAPGIKKKLEKAQEDSASILVSGATGSGKTSLLSALLKKIPPNSRVLILEDSPELKCPNALSTKLLARSNRFGFRLGAKWELSDLVIESLRMRPDRLILGECRGPEALGLANALQTGHRGLMTTIHAGSAQQALKRFEELVIQAAPHSKNLGAQDLWDLALHVELNKDNGRRWVKEAYEIGS